MHPSRLYRVNYIIFASFLILDTILSLESTIKKGKNNYAGSFWNHFQSIFNPIYDCENQKPIKRTNCAFQFIKEIDDQMDMPVDAFSKIPFLNNFKLAW